MIVHISEIPDEGLEVESPGDLGPVFAEEGWHLDAVGLHIERRGGDVVVTGSFQATVELQCSRCLEPLVTHVGPDVDLHLVPTPSVRHEQVELSPDDLELDFYQGEDRKSTRLNSSH